MQVTGEVAPNQGQTNSSHTQESHFDWVSVLGGETKWGSVSVMLLVDVLVKDTVVQTSVEPVVPGVFHYKEETQLQEYFGNRREWNREGHSDLSTKWMEEPNGEGLNHKVGHEDGFHTFPLLGQAWKLGVLNLVLLEVRDTVNDEPGQTTAEIHDLVHQEEKETSG